VRIHSNAKTTPVSRAAMIGRRKEGWTVGMIAAAHDVSEATVHKWIRRNREEGKAGLIDRTSRPRRFHRPVSQVRICQIVRLRRQRLTGWQTRVGKRLRKSPPKRVACLMRGR
jgi:transposase